MTAVHPRLALSDATNSRPAHGPTRLFPRVVPDHEVAFDPSLIIGSTPADTAADTAALLVWGERLASEQPRVLGFPGALDFDFRSLGPLLSVLANNVGDPQSADASNIHAKSHELAIIRFCAELAGTPPHHTYGYVTSGGTEGIERGLELARHQLPHAHLYASDQAHYAVGKISARLGLTLQTVPSQPDGSMAPHQLRDRARAHRMTSPGRGPGAIVLASIGTTFRGAYDNVGELRHAAAAAGDVYIHADAALAGFAAPYLPTQPSWSIADGSDSLSMSGHKFIGLPMPAGVFLARHEAVPSADGAEYVRATDRTWGCSRSGLAVLCLWSALRRLGHEGLGERVRRCLDTAAYAVTQLERVGVRPERHPDGLVVTFDRPAAWVAERWHLACEGQRAHLVAVAHVTRDAIDELCADLTTGSP
ncbi:pyridoxal-dependent decarboxylase [Streptomyces sp. NPDC051572]|uniref:pyridoxal-dependent decarboxylase n=1 Tax=Streptomyces sp. NPDC051572 TaxID=3155802 RepID=UPI00344D1D1E